MNTQTLRLYGTRFGWEIAACWLIAAANTALFFQHPLVHWQARTGLLEQVALCWITLRLVLAEDVFLTRGGWRTRPISAKSGWLTPLLLASLVVFMPAVVRLILFGPQTEGNVRDWLGPPLFWLVGLALPLKLVGHFLAASGKKDARMAVLVLLLGIGFLVFIGRLKDAWLPAPAESEIGRNPPQDLAQGIQRELPGTRQFLGRWYDPPRGPALPAAKMVATFPVSGAVLHGVRTSVSFSALIVSPEQFDALNTSVWVLKYPDGSVASCDFKSCIGFDKTMPLCPVRQVACAAEFVSPSPCLPWRTIPHG